MNTFENSENFANQLDESDSLSHFRNEFLFPQLKGKQAIYLTGNSLGLQPKSVRDALDVELKDWEHFGVDGHFSGTNPWFHYHKFLNEKAAKIVGALPHEVVVMNNLTVNLHLMMVSFYRPSKEKYKIIMEAGAFPSDQYAMESQVRFHGFDPEDAIIEIAPRKGEHNLRMEDILETIDKNADKTALIMFSGVQYYTGQAFDIQKITSKGHEYGITVGFDLAHAAGNILLDLHQWDVDFAVWCGYKYLNSGPGGVSGVFVHDRFANRPDLPRFAGWWGHKESERFLMKKGYIPEFGAAGWQLSNAPVLTMAVHKASLEIFNKAGMQALVEKSKKITSYLEYILKSTAPELNIITPALERGSQLSILTNDNGKKLFNHLEMNHILADWREPNVIRMAPVPLYTSYKDVYCVGLALSTFGK
ncbi:MAG: kynureninase [Flavobacteriales bacterium]|nr:kynureninase [Flavobacteriales bacterium]